MLPSYCSPPLSCPWNMRCLTLLTWWRFFQKPQPQSPRFQRDCLPWRWRPTCDDSKTSPAKCTQFTSVKADSPTGTPSICSSFKPSSSPAFFWLLRASISSQTSGLRRGCTSPSSPGFPWPPSATGLPTSSTSLEKREGPSFWRTWTLAIRSSTAMTVHHNSEPPLRLYPTWRTTWVSKSRTWTNYP